MNCFRVSYLVVFLCFVSLIFANPLIAGIDLPWATTFDCDTDANPGNGDTNWMQYSAPLICDGVGKDLGSVDSCGDYEHIYPTANYSAGGGGKGQRHWVGPGKNDNSGGISITFNNSQNEIWIRWYMRYESGFEWSSNQPMEKIVYFIAPSNVQVRWTNGQAGIYDGHSHFTSGNNDWVTYIAGADGKGDGTWHCYEVHLNNSAGTAQWWIDGTKVLDKTGINYGGNFASFHFPSNQDYVVHPGCKALDLDDVAISNTGYIGPIGGGSKSSDTSSPSVSIMSPTPGQTVSATVTVAANASDNVGVAGAQFKCDGVNLGVEDTTSPYSISLDTTAFPDGSHTLTAVARDAAGNRTSSNPVTVTFSNNVGGGGSGPSQILYEDWENNNFNNWDDDFRQGDTYIDTSPVYNGNYAIKMESSDPGSYVHFFGDHPGLGGQAISDVSVEEYLYLSPNFQWPSIGMKLWIMNCFESWGAGYNLAAGQQKPDTWAPYYMAITVSNNGTPFGNLTRADGLGGPGDLWHNYPQNVGTPVALSPGTWNKVRFRLMLNSPGQSDGIFQLWINDVLKCNYYNLNFRGDYSAYGWNHLIMTIYPNPSHPQAQWVSRDNILIVSNDASNGGSTSPPPPPGPLKLTQ